MPTLFRCSSCVAPPQLDKEERRFLLLAALLLPLRALQHVPPRGKPGPATAAVIRDSLKWRVKVGWPQGGSSGKSTNCGVTAPSAPARLPFQGKHAHNPSDLLCAGGSELESIALRYLRCSSLCCDSLCRWPPGRQDIDMTAALHDTAAEFARAHALLNDGAGAAAAAAAAAAADGSEAGQDVRVVLGQAIRKLKQHWKLGERIGRRGSMAGGGVVVGVGVAEFVPALGGKMNEKPRRSPASS